MDLISDASQNITERLVWHTALKDQAGIAKDMADGKDIEEIYGLGDAALFDEFFSFLSHFGITDLALKLKPKIKKRETETNFRTVFSIYVMRIIAGCPYFGNIKPVLLQSQPLMRRLGFNARQIREGTSARGLHKSAKGNEPKPDDDEIAEIRGPVCPQFISFFIGAILASALERFFNTVISILAQNSFFPKHIHAVMDASEIQSTERCVGCGKVSKEKAPELRRRGKRIRKVLETVFGFKIWVVWDSLSKLPIAMRFTTIEVGDIKMAREVVQQAVDNVGDKVKIVSLAFDRGDVVGIEGLTSAGFYGEKGSGSHENSNNFKPNPINAVVVRHDPYKENNPDSDTMVILTNGTVNEPLVTYDGYDARSEIENSLFREAKQTWFIERPPENTKNAFRAHVYLTIITMALTTAFRTWMDQQDKLEPQGKETGIRKFREKVRQENGSKLIVFDGEKYAIFDAYEVVILCGRNVRSPRGVPERSEKKDILNKYGVLRE